MNAHWTLFYYGAAFVIGMFSAGLATVTSLRTGLSVVRTYLMFYLSLTATLAIDLLITYTETNLSLEPGRWFSGLYFVSIAVSSLLVWTFPVFVHALYDLRSQRKRNLIAGILASIRYIGLNGLILFSETQGKVVSITFFFLSDLLLVVTIGYGVWVSLRHYVRVRNTSQRITAGSLAGVFLVLASVTLEDQVMGIVEEVWLYPLAYAIVGIFFSLYFLKWYWPRFSQTIHLHPSCAPSSPETPGRAAETGSDSGVAMDDPEAAFKAFSEQYCISPREQDVLRLLLQGRTNVAIAETLLISTNTVKTHIGSIYGKVGVNRRYELISRCTHLNPPASYP